MLAAAEHEGLRKEIFMTSRLKEIPARSHPHYDAERIEELRHKYAAEPEPEFLDWRDAEAFDAGVPRQGEI
jgi:hypothetical protein